MKDSERDDPEVERLRRLAEYRISRTDPEASFDDVVHLAVEIFDVPIAFICITERETHWFKSRFGIDLLEVPRSSSFCDHALKSDGILIVEDASKDERFCHSPMVTGPYHIRFYAGVTLRDTDGFALGTLVISDSKPRHIAHQKLQSLARLAAIIVDRLELRKTHSHTRGELTIAKDAHRSAIADNAELRQVLECLPEAIVVMDAENRILLWNKNYEKMFAGISQYLQPGIQYEFMLKKSLEFHTYAVASDSESQEAW